MTGIPHCRPGCRSCEASDRLLRLSTVLDEYGRSDLADALQDVAELAGQKSSVGALLAAVVLDDTGGGVG